MARLVDIALTAGFTLVVRGADCVAVPAPEPGVLCGARLAENGAYFIVVVLDIGGGVVRDTAGAIKAGDDVLCVVVVGLVDVVAGVDVPVVVVGDADVVGGVVIDVGSVMVVVDAFVAGGIVVVVVVVVVVIVVAAAAAVGYAEVC